MKKRKLINILILSIAIIAIGFGVLFYFKLNKLQNNYKETQITEKQKQFKKEADSLISKVSDLYLFPEGDTPTIATVSDPLLLKNQAFFSNSEKGDKVLFFSKTGKAVLYRPNINKIVDVTSISSDSINKNN